MIPAITAIVAENLKHLMRDIEIAPGTAFASIKDFDDTARGGIAVDVENRFDVDFGDEVVAGWKTVACIAGSVLAARREVNASVS